MTRSVGLAVFFILSATLLASDAGACSGCFRECHNYLVSVEEFHEPLRSIACAFWYGSYGSVENPVVLQREVPEWAAGEPWLKEYVALWNKHLSRTPNRDKVKRAPHYFANHNCETVIRLLRRDNRIFVPVVLKGPNSQVVDLFRTALAFHSESGRHVPRRVRLELFMVQLNGVGGKTEWGWGVDPKSKPKRIFSQAISTKNGQPIELPIPLGTLTEMWEDAKLSGIVLGVTVLEFSTPAKKGMADGDKVDTVATVYGGRPDKVTGP